MTVEHPALKSKSGITAGMLYTASQVAHEQLGITVEEFLALPRDVRLTEYAAYEVRWRSEAIAEYEAHERARRESKKKKK